MALRITLKPGEKMILGGAVITNGNSFRCHLIVENKVPILREKDILSESEANSLCRKIYFVIQLMYIDEENLNAHQKSYWKLVKQLIKAAPSSMMLIDQISEEIVGGRYYQALKWAQKLIDYEREVISRVQQSVASIRNCQQNNHVGSGNRSGCSHKGCLQAQGVPAKLG